MRKLTPGDVLIPVAIIIAGAMISGSIIWTAHQAAQQQVAAAAPADTALPGQQAAPPPANIADVNIKNSPFIGQANAPVVMAYWFDYQCPYCAAADVQYGEAIARWVLGHKGTMRLDFYDVALRQHPTAPAAAHAARCAGEQQRYAAARKAIFAAQKEWAGAFNAQERVTALARATVRDTGAFNRCMEEDPTSLYATLGANLARGKELGIPGTPTYVVRIGERKAQVVDPVSPDSLAKVVRALEKVR